MFLLIYSIFSNCDCHSLSLNIPVSNYRCFIGGVKVVDYYINKHLKRLYTCVQLESSVL